jgi:hypothetical protein
MMDAKPRPALPNFSRDTKSASLAAAALAGLLAFSTLAATGALFWQAQSYEAEEAEALAEASAVMARLVSLREQTAASEPESAAIGALRQRIAALKSLDVGAAPPVTRLLVVLEEIAPASVALDSLAYDRAAGTLDLVASSDSSEALTDFFDAANRNSLFESVRVVDKKQAGGENADSLFEIRLSMRLRSGES